MIDVNTDCLTSSETAIGLLCKVNFSSLTGGLAPTSGGVKGGVVEELWLESLLMSEKGRGFGTTN